MENLIKDNTYTFGAWNSKFKVLAVYGNEAWIKWLDSCETEVIPLKMHELHEFVDDQEQSTGV